MKIKISKRSEVISLYLMELMVLLQFLELFEVISDIDTIKYTAFIIAMIPGMIAFFKRILIQRHISLLSFLLLAYILYLILVLIVTNKFDAVSITASLSFPMAFLVSVNIEFNSEKYTKFVNCQLWIMLIFAMVYLYHQIMKGTLHGAAIVNSVYYCVAFLGVLTASRYKKRGIICLAVIGSLCMISVRMTAILMWIIAVLCNCTARWIRNRGKVTCKTVLTASCIVISLLFIWNRVSTYVFHTILPRLDLVVETGGSNRTGIYQNILRKISDSDFPQVVFGHGFGTVQNVTGGATAHNGFLECLYEFGIIGLFLLTAIFLALAFSCKRDEVILTMLILLVVQNMTSNILYVASYIILSGIFLGSRMSNIDREGKVI